MSANTALITDAATTAARQTLSDYSDAVFAHVTGDWSKHNVVRVYDTQFSDQAGHVDSAKTLRILATNATNDVALALPIQASGSSVLLTSPPIITVQPVSLITTLGSLERFTVGAISDTPLSFQWYQNGLPLSGETASQLVFPGVVATNNSVASVVIPVGYGAYYVIVTNRYGSVRSLSVTLQIATQARQGSDDGGGFLGLF